jgi:hypothetical protein
MRETGLRLIISNGTKFFVGSMIDFADKNKYNCL